ALGNSHRLEILEHLAQSERSVEALSKRVGLSTANTSQHLQQLRGLALPPHGVMASSFYTVLPMKLCWGCFLPCGSSPSAMLPRWIGSSADISLTGTAWNLCHMKFCSNAAVPDW
ncbi:MAG: ArsR family transcriptional regulator, partial [Fimbriimonadaceae bacterium]|nr:ArsR family transcriptional regulator [Alphaproteobacteria bacterium]